MNVRPIVVGSPYHELIKPLGRRAKAALVLEILRDYVRVRRYLWRRDLPSVVAALRTSPDGADDRRSQAIGLRLGHAVARTLAWMPFDSRCLVRSLVLTSMLDRRGIRSRLVIGVSVEPSFSAHAWVECDGRPLLPPLDEANRLVDL